MLDVVFYHTTQDLAHAEFDSHKPLIICPSPLVADGLRRLMPPGLEIITISKWVSDFLKLKNKKKANKAELMLRLSSVWRHYFPESDIQIFLRSFELFTDLRSFSLNLDLLSEFLKETDPQITKSVLIFWAFVNSEDIVDEHRSYQIMGEIEIVRPVWMIGFKHLSGIQIDMLKELGERTSVNVFFPKDVYLETLSTDWIRWIVPEFKIDAETEKKKTRIIYYPKNKLNLVLDDIKQRQKNFDIMPACQQLDFNSRQEVISSGQFFKSPEDLFSAKRDVIFEALLEIVKKTVVHLEEFKGKIAERKKTTLQNQDYISYKIHSLIEEALVFYGEFQSFVDSFSLKILKLIIELNSPRVSLAALSSSTATRFFELNELPYRMSPDPLMIVASSNYGSLKAGEGNYSEKMIEALRSIAPIKRGGLDFSMLKNDLRIALANPGSTLMMEEGLELTDLSWREVLKDFEIEVLNPGTEFKLKAKKDYLSEQMKPGPFPVASFSASRVQTFMDCPRKYYFSYVEKLDHRPEERLELGSDELGTLEHVIIQKYFQQTDLLTGYSSDVHKQIVRAELDAFVSKNKMKLNEKTRQATFFEIFNYSQAGIEFLITYCQENNASNIRFEVELEKNEWNLSGSIDCLVELSGDRIGLFDFKRSYAAIGSKNDTLRLEKIQIWVYLLYLIKHKKLSVQTWGYLNLSDTDKSLVLNEAKEQILTADSINLFESFLLEKENHVKSEISFLAVPRNVDVCKFCEVKLFCSKGAGKEGVSN